MSPKLKAMLIEFDQLFRRTQSAMLNNTRPYLFERQEELLHDYWQRRSQVLLRLENDDEVMAVADLKTFIDAMTVKAEEVEKTMVKR
jgi:vacuolar-type H+-ATPase subunit E/Vma4